VLRKYRDRARFASFTQADLEEYAKYKGVINSFRSHYALSEFSFKEIDKFLWLTARSGTSWPLAGANPAGSAISDEGAWAAQLKAARRRGGAT
jgi:hypothetical protein